MCVFLLCAFVLCLWTGPWAGIAIYASYMLSSGPGTTLYLQPGVLAAEWEAITALGGTLIYVM